jgi:hypothetical protein
VSKVFIFTVNLNEETLKSVSSDSEKRYSKGIKVEEMMTAKYLQDAKQKLIDFTAQLVVSRYKL